MPVISMLSNIHPERHRCVVRGSEKDSAGDSDLLIYFFFMLRKKKDFGNS